MHNIHSPYGVYPPTESETFELSDDAMRLRRYFEDCFLDRGEGPDLRDITSDLGMSEVEAWEALYLLERGVQVMFVPGTENLVKMPPFSYVPTRHRVSAEGGKRWYAGCAGEAFASSKLFKGRVISIDSMCPDCWGSTIITMKDGEILSVDPPETVFHMGIHPDLSRQNFIELCDNLNFFRSAEHVATWEAAIPNKRGVTMPLELCLSMVDSVAASRYWNYERGPDVVPLDAGERMIAAWRAAGVDVSAWE
jgi:hypothetical protein